MSWVKVDDQLHIHRKVRKAGAPALGLHLLALSYCGYHYQTEGFIPDDDLSFLFGIAQLPEKAGRKAVQRLVEVGLWDEADDGYRLHDWLAYNRGAAKVEADRDATLQRVHKLRERKRSDQKTIGKSKFSDQKVPGRNPDGEPRDAPSAGGSDARNTATPNSRNAVTPGVTPTVTEGVTGALQTERNGVRNASPVPVPVPVPITPPNLPLDAGANGRAAEVFSEVQGPNASAVNEALASITQRAAQPAASGFVRSVLDTFTEVAGRPPSRLDMDTAMEWEREYRYLNPEDARRTMRKAAGHWEHQGGDPARTLKAFTEWIQRENAGLADAGRRKAR